MEDREYYIYLMTNENNTVIYTGVTNDLVRRVWEHREGLERGFCKRYNVKKLVYFESCGDIYSAIGREKQIKAGSRRKKLDLIQGMNPGWEDLYPELQ